MLLASILGTNGKWVKLKRKGTTLFPTLHLPRQLEAHKLSRTMGAGAPITPLPLRLCTAQGHVVPGVPSVVASLVNIPVCSICLLLELWLLNLDQDQNEVAPRCF